MKKLFLILFIFVSTICYSQTEKADTAYLPGKFFITNWVHQKKLHITINKWQEIKPIKIKGLLYIIPYGVYLENKTLVESKIDLNKCAIRRVRKDELIEPKE